LEGGREMEKIKKVEPGTIVPFEGTDYVFGQGSARSFNAWVNVLSRGLSPDRVLGEIHLWGKNGESILLSYQEIAKILAK
jgi:hypothetical protein